MLSPTVMVDIFHAEAALFPLKNPGAISVPLSFFAGVVVSLLWPEPAAAARFAEAESRMHLGATAGRAPAPAPAPPFVAPAPARTRAPAH